MKRCFHCGVAVPEPPPAAMTSDAETAPTPAATGEGGHLPIATGLSHRHPAADDSRRDSQSRFLIATFQRDLAALHEQYAAELHEYIAIDVTR